MEIRQPYPPGSPHDRGPGYERRDANIAGLLQFAFWMAVVLVVTLVGMKFTFDHFKKVQPLGATTSPMVSEAERTLPPGPLLQAQPHIDLEEFCAAQEQAVNSYSWINQEAGTVHVPMDLAMDLVLSRACRRVRRAKPRAASCPMWRRLRTSPAEWIFRVHAAI